MAVGWGLLLFVAAATVPVYDSETATATSDGSATGEVTSGTATAVEVNGWGVAIAFGFPLLVALVVSVALWFRDHPAALPIAWTLTAVLGMLNLLAMLSIGIFVLPVTVALVVACSSARRATAAPVPTATAVGQPPA